ncbi:alpha/beta hydrolase [Bacterioplanoides sp.]|uniref:alpha/beta hydrolase n=1 Tax=Bacterioplanoides sp. TaxID=2066072 RepID=UPI003B5BCE85
MSGISEWLADRLKTTLLIVCLLLSGCSSLTSLYFYPQTVWIQTPEALGLEYQDVWLAAADGTELHGWWLPGQSPDKHLPGQPLAEDNEQQAASDLVVLFLHGNAENVSSHVRNVEWLPPLGVSVFALDYRGFGASQGEALMPSVLQDVEAAAIWLKTHFPDKKLVVLGQSMGAALAVNFVAAAQDRYQIQALVLDAPFAGFPQIARSALTSTWLGWIFVPFTWLIPADWNPVDKASKITIPTLVMHSPYDQVIPYEQGQAVFQQLGGERCWLDSRGGHIATFSFLTLRQSALSFIEQKKCIGQAAFYRGWALENHYDCANR